MMVRCVLFIAILICNTSARAEQPNVVLIIADDLGWTDGGVFGSDYYRTPHLDQLASQSMRFTDAYANAPNCAPSRACLMTGLYTPRHGIYTVGTSARGKTENRRIIPIDNTLTLASEFTTLAERFRDAGYATCFAGKWHLGADADTLPTGQGFDINIGGGAAGHPKSYFSPYQNPHLSDGPVGEHLTARLTSDSIAFIDEHAHQQFFLTLSYYAVHTPLQAPADRIEHFRNRPGGQHHTHATYAAMIEAMDAGIGDLLATLDDLKIADNTIVVFISDNGGVLPITSNAPLRGGKGMLYEGGIRVPLLARWPGHIAAGSICDTPVIGTDVYPTLLDCVGMDIPEDLDGVSLRPILTGTGLPERDAIYWHFPAYLEAGRAADGHWRTTPAGAIRAGDWKLIEFFEDGHSELYNLADDVGESHDLSQMHPQRAGKLRRGLEQWRERVNAPVPIERNPAYRAGG